MILQSCVVECRNTGFILAIMMRQELVKETKEYMITLKHLNVLLDVVIT
jgi:hypothetical protein